MKIIQKIWEKEQRATYREFVRYLNNAPPSGEPVHISKQTFSRLIHEFLQEYDIKKYEKLHPSEAVRSSKKNFSLCIY